MRRQVRRVFRRAAHRVRTGLPATSVTFAAALVFATLATFVAALAHSEPPVVVRGAPVADRVMRYLGTYQADRPDAQNSENAAVASASRRFLGDVPGRVYRIDASAALSVVGTGAQPFSAPAVAITSPDIASYATLISGRWPTTQAPGGQQQSQGQTASAAAATAATATAATIATAAATTATASAPIDVAIPESLAGSQDLHPGSVLKLDTPAEVADPAAGQSVTVVGVYRPDSSAFWQALPPAALPAISAHPARALVVAPDALAAGLGRAGDTTWIVDPGLDGLSASRLSALVDRANTAIVTQDARAVPGAALISPAIIVSSNLPEQRAVARRATVAGEAELAVPVGVLILLAVTAMARTSSETVRAVAVDEHGAEQHVAEEYVMLDRAGRMQLPRDYVERLRMRDRVRVAFDEDHVSVWPTALAEPVEQEADQEADREKEN